MAEYIEKEKVALILREEAAAHYPTPYHVGLLAAARAIDSIPAADVRPVVFCKDCKQYAGRPWENNESGICARTDVGVGEDDFCSYGEKLEES